MESLNLVLIAVAGVVALVAAVVWAKVHPFVALLTAAIGVGLAAGMPPDAVIAAISGGMGSTLGFVAVVVGLGSMFGAMLQVKDAHPEDFASLRLLVSGGEPLPDAVASRFYERFGVRINEGYGLTETSPVTNWCRPDEYTPHSVGKPLPEIEQRILDLSTGRPLPPGEDGEVQVRGPNVMKGYYKLPEQTRAAFTDDGFFRTGDIGRTNLEGHLFITGRLKEMLIIGGENVFPREIEEVLSRHPTIAASGVIGIKDPVRGELPVAFVELNEGQTFDERALQQWCRQHLAGYKVPSEIRCVPQLPRNPTGKIMRRELKNLL